MVPREKYSFRGSVTAYAVADGAVDWQVWLTKGDGTEGAGVGVWSTPAVDAERGLLYVGTGNTYEPPASTMADSIVAIRYDTGEIAWSHQFTFPDVFSGGYQEGADADVGAGPEPLGAGRPGAGRRRRQDRHVLRARPRHRRGRVADRHDRRQRPRRGHRHVGHRRRPASTSAPTSATP